MNPLTWHGDNREFVIEYMLPSLRMPRDVRQVLRWAYGYDGSDHSYEMASDGSTFVPDAFMLGRIKEPPGVGHDYLNRVPNHTTPDGKAWTSAQSCEWYRKAMLAFNYSKTKARIRYWGLMLSRPFWWR
jgi:hypothetical protein